MLEIHNHLTSIFAEHFEMIHATFRSSRLKVKSKLKPLRFVFVERACRRILKNKINSSDRLTDVIILQNKIEYAELVKQKFKNIL